jgi:hypothetical protein
MQLRISIFGRQVLHITTEPDQDSSQRPTLEATSGGQFEIGFSNTRDAEVMSQRRHGGQLQCRATP